MDHDYHNPPLGDGGIFVTGGAGLVGSALLKQLLQQNNTPIRALYRNSMPVTLSDEEKNRIECGAALGFRR